MIKVHYKARALLRNLIAQIKLFCAFYKRIFSFRYTPLHSPKPHNGIRKKTRTRLVRVKRQPCKGFFSHYEHYYSVP